MIFVTIIDVGSLVFRFVTDESELHFLIVDTVLLVSIISTLIYSRVFNYKAIYVGMLAIMIFYHQSLY